MVKLLHVGLSWLCSKTALKDVRVRPLRHHAESKRHSYVLQLVCDQRPPHVDFHAGRNEELNIFHHLAAVKTTWIYFDSLLTTRRVIIPQTKFCISDSLASIWPRNMEHLFWAYKEGKHTRNTHTHSHCLAHTHTYTTPWASLSPA